MGLIQSFGTGPFAPAVPINIRSKVNSVSPNDQELVNYCDSILTYKDDQIARITNYSGANEEMRLAMSQPTEDNELKAFNKLLVNVDHISHIYNFSTAIEQIIPPLFDTLCGNPSQSTDLAQRRELALNASQTKIAIMQRTIELLAFVITFDSIRIQKPLVANDFSYYRRILPKYQHHPAVPPSSVRVHDEDASVIALFTGLYNPLFCAVKKAVSVSASSAGQPINSLPAMGGTGVNNGPGIGGGAMVNDVLATIANSCLAAIRQELANGTSSKQDFMLNAAKAMTVALVMYDHNYTLGAFSKRSLVRSKEIIELLLKHFAHTPSIIALIKYSSHTLANAPEKIQELLQ